MLTKDNFVPLAASGAGNVERGNQRNAKEILKVNLSRFLARS